jgi:hypothetical protein
MTGAQYGHTGTRARGGRAGGRRCWPAAPAPLMATTHGLPAPRRAATCSEAPVPHPVLHRIPPATARALHFKRGAIGCAIRIWAAKHDSVLLWLGGAPAATPKNTYLPGEI